MEFGASEQGVDLVQSPDQGHTLHLRQEVKVGGPGGAGAQAALVHDGQGQAQVAVEGGGLNETAGGGGLGSEAGALGDGGDQVAGPKVGEGPDPYAAGVVAGEGEGVAADDAVGSHPSLESSQPPVLGHLFWRRRVELRSSGVDASKGHIAGHFKYRIPGHIAIVTIHSGFLN